MYEPESILVLKEQRTVGTPPVGAPADPDYVPPSEDYVPFPYDRVRVVGQSPISHANQGEDWNATDAQGVVVTPITSFGATLDEPYGKLRKMYDVESVPLHEAPAALPVRVINSTSGSAGPTPEEQFAEEAPGVVPEPGQRRGRTLPESPLDGPSAEPEPTSPLGNVEVPVE